MYIIYTHLALRFHSRSSKACFPAARYLQDIPPEKQGGSEREPERGSAGLYSNFLQFRIKRGVKYNWKPTGQLVSSCKLTVQRNHSEHTFLLVRC